MFLGSALQAGFFLRAIDAPFFQNFILRGHDSYNTFSEVSRVR
jgi:hypothetical protein